MTDPALTAAALERPGEVLKVSRGDLSAQLKALAPRVRKASPGEKASEPAKKPRGNAAKPPRPPKRDKVNAAEAALKGARQRHQAETKKLEAQRDAIDRQLATLQAKQAKELDRLEKQRARARDAYRTALEKWSG